jgi:hypothetical protein
MALSLLEHTDSTKHYPQRTLDHPDVRPAAFSKWLYTSMKFTSLALIFAILKISLNLLDEKFGLSEQCHNQLICFASLSICAYKLSVICISKTKIPVIHDSVCWERKGYIQCWRQITAISFNSPGMLSGWRVPKLPKPHSMFSSQNSLLGTLYLSKSLVSIWLLIIHKSAKSESTPVFTDVCSALASKSNNENVMVCWFESV